MALKRASCQTRNDLRGRYVGMSSGEPGRDDLRKMEEGMLALIERLETRLAQEEVWGLTSLFFLNLLAVDDYRSPWLVTISPPDGDVFRIEYLVPPAEAPWSNAKMRGEAKGIDDAEKMILVAMEKCGGWPGLR